MPSPKSPYNLYFHYQKLAAQMKVFFLNCILLSQWQSTIWAHLSPSESIWTHLNPSEPFLNCILLNQWQSPIRPHLIPTWIVSFSVSGNHPSESCQRPAGRASCNFGEENCSSWEYIWEEKKTIQIENNFDSFISSFRNNFKNVIILKNSFHFSDSNFCLCALWYW